MLVVFGPLLGLLLLYGKSIPQDPKYHLLADTRTWLGIANFGNVASNIAFLIVGLIGMAWCRRHPGLGARRSWMMFFLGVALVFFGSGYYHLSPNNETLVWDRLPITIAFMGLFAALLSEHLPERIELPLLIPALAVGVASVFLWKATDDLRVYIWVQAMPLVAVPLVIALYPGRYTHRHYLIYGVACYALAKVAEHFDSGIYELTARAISGHSLKHLLAALAPFCVYLMLRRRTKTS